MGLAPSSLGSRPEKRQAASLHAIKSLSFPGEDGTSNLQLHPVFLSVSAWRKENGTRRPPLLRIDVCRGYVVALDWRITHRSLRSALAVASKTAVSRCYNLI